MKKILTFNLKCILKISVFFTICIQNKYLQIIEYYFCKKLLNVVDIKTLSEHSIKSIHYFFLVYLNIWNFKIFSLGAFCKYVMF